MLYILYIIYMFYILYIYKVHPCTGTEAVYRPYGLYRVSVPVQECTLPFPLLVLITMTSGSLHTHTHKHKTHSSIYIATLVIRTRHNVTLHTLCEHWMSCLTARMIMSECVRKVLRPFVSTQVFLFSTKFRDGSKVPCKVKQPQYRPGQALRVPGGWGSQISRQSSHESAKVDRPTHRPPLPPWNIPGTHSC